MRNKTVQSFGKVKALFDPILIKVGLLTARLKVFHQVLLIIGIMLFFMVVLTFTSVQLIGSINHQAQQVIDKTGNSLSLITSVKLSLEELRYGYLHIMLVARTPGANVTHQEKYLADAKTNIAILKSTDKNLSEQILKGLEQLEALLALEKNGDNFTRFQIKIANINQMLRDLETEVYINSKELVTGTVKSSQDSQLISIIILFVTAFIALIIGLAMATSIAKPLNAVSKAAQSLALGDLTKNIEDQGCPEVKDVVNGLNKAIFELRKLVEGINQHSNLLLTASTELKEASINSGQSSNQVAQAMEELAKGSSEQVDQINHAFDTVNALSAMVQKVTDDTEQMTKSSEKVAKSAKLGQEVTTNMAHEIHELYQSTTEVATVIEALNKTSDEINEMTGMIQGIAEQTALLALNASIEAARAGEHGKGFSVVAEETGKLADQSKQAASLISNRIKEMRKRNLVAIEIIHREVERIDAGKKMADGSVETFVQIFEELQNNLNQIEMVAKSARQMAASNKEVISVFTTLAAISEESSTSTEEVSATAEEQSALAQEVTAMADNLAQIAEDLKQSVTVFKTSNS